MDKFQFYFELFIFITLLSLYIFIATRRQSKLTKIGEIAALYTTTIFFQFSKTLSTILFLFAALIVILFNFKRAKRNERGTERIGR